MNSILNEACVSDPDLLRYLIFNFLRIFRHTQILLATGEMVYVALQTIYIYRNNSQQSTRENITTLWFVQT
jgi:hypothetical protein